MSKETEQLGFEFKSESGTIVRVGRTEKQGGILVEMTTKNKPCFQSNEDGSILVIGLTTGTTITLINALVRILAEEPKL